MDGGWRLKPRILKLTRTEPPPILGNGQERAVAGPPPREDVTVLDLSRLLLHYRPALLQRLLFDSPTPYFVRPDAHVLALTNRPGMMYQVSRSVQLDAARLPSKEGDHLFSEKERSYLKRQPLARIATVSKEFQPDVATVEYEFDGEYFYVGELRLGATLKYSEKPCRRLLVMRWYNRMIKHDAHERTSVLIVSKLFSFTT
jgi:hypothetical protein